MAGTSNITGQESIIFADNASFDGTERGGRMTTDGQFWIGSSTSPHVRLGNIASSDSSITVTPGAGSLNLSVTGGTTTGKTITGNTGGALSPVSGNWNVLGNNSAATGFATFTSGSGNTLTAQSFGVAKWVVNPVAGIGTHQTIQSAITSASSGETIFITPGTYTENLTLKAGVSITAFTGDQDTPNVTIVGKATFSAAGTCSISNIRLQTNGDFLLAVTGSAASIVNLDNCYLNCTNNTGISFTSSSSSSRINIYDCEGNIGTTGIAPFSFSGAGTILARNWNFFNSGGSTTASTSSGSGGLDFGYVYMNSPITSSGTGGAAITNTILSMPSLNTTALTVGSGTAYSVVASLFASGTASAISVAGTLDLFNSKISSSNSNAVTGAGTLNYSGLTFDSSSTMNVTTQNPFVLNGGSYKGRITNTAPPAGMIGEQIRGFLQAASAITLTTTTAANITSISLTPGIWDVSGIVAFNGAVTGTAYGGSISAVSATNGTPGDSQVTTTASPGAAADSMVSIPSFRVSLSATTTYYLVTIAVFSAGTCKSYGRISATRVS